MTDPATEADALDALDAAIQQAVAEGRDDPRLVLGWAVIIAHEAAVDNGKTAYLLRTSHGQAAHSTLGLLGIGTDYVLSPEEEAP